MPTLTLTFKKFRRLTNFLSHHPLYTHIPFIYIFYNPYLSPFFAGWLLSHVQLFCDTMDCSPPGSSVHGISNVRMLEWVAIPFSKGSFWFRDQTHISWIGKQVLYCWATWEAPFSPRLGGFDHRDLFPHSPGGWESEIRVQAELVSSWGLSPRLVDGHILPASSDGLLRLGLCSNLFF